MYGIETSSSFFSRASDRSTWIKEDKVKAYVRNLAILIAEFIDVLFLNTGAVQ
jgi:hypothetical protein